MPKRSRRPIDGADFSDAARRRHSDSDGEDSSPPTKADRASLRERRQRLKAIADPLQLAILTRLQLEPATAAQVSEGLGIDAPTVRSALEKLRRGCQVMTVGKAAPRGRPENLYAVDLRSNVLNPGDISGAPEDLVDAAQVSLLSTMYREAAEAVDAGVFASRPTDCVLLRLPLYLDERCLSEILELHRRLLWQTIGEAGRAEARLAEGEEKPILVTATILFFKYPIESWPQPPVKAEAMRRKSSTASAERHLPLCDPLRIWIVEALFLAPASGPELAQRLSTPYSQLRHEIDRLLEDGYVTVVERRPSRGTVERVFTVDLQALVVPTGDLAQYSRESANLLYRRGVQLIFRSALTATREGFFRSDDCCIARVPMPLDSEGYTNISRMVAEMCEEMVDLREESLARAPKQRSLALSSLLLFERAPGELGS